MTVTVLIPFLHLLSGNETRNTELRYRCCIEMVKNRAKMMRHRLFSRIHLISPDYDEDCLDCAKSGSYSSAWRMIAISNLLNLPVQSVYPCMNGSKHIAFTTLNNLFRPPFADPEKNSLTIMWTNTSMPEKNSFTISQRKSKRERTESFCSFGK